jgi:hypothetical protein
MEEIANNSMTIESTTEVQHSPSHPDDSGQVTAAAPNQVTVAAPTTQKRPKNALTHGVYADELILPWENENDLIKLRDDMWAEHHPEGPTEEETALGLVHLMWTKRRLLRTTQLGFRLDPFELEVERSKPKDFDDIVDAIKSGFNQMGTLCKATKEALDAFKLAAAKVSEITVATISGHNQQGPAKDAFLAAQAAERGVSTVNMFFDQVFDRMCKLEEAQKSGIASVYQRAYSHDHIEKVLQIEAKLDARIDKQLARLVRLQEYRRMRRETLKTIDSTCATEPTKQ